MSEPIRYCVGFLFDIHCQKVVLIRKVRPAWQRGKLNGVGGHIEENETPAAAMRREFMEEAGRDEMQWTRFCVLSGDNYELHCFYCVSDPRYANTPKGSEETIEVHPINPLPKDVIPNLHWLIPLALSGESIVGTYSP